MDLSQTCIELSTPDKLKYHFFPIRENTIQFRIRAPNDAHIALTTTPYLSDPMYEVFIGGWSNTKSVIRKDRVKPDVFETQTSNILSNHEFRGFWIRWDGNKISAGKEGVQEPFLIYTDRDPIHISYFGVCTGWNASGQWKIEVNPSAANYNPEVPLAVQQYQENQLCTGSSYPIPIAPEHQGFQSVTHCSNVGQMTRPHETIRSEIIATPHHPLGWIPIPSAQIEQHSWVNVSAGSIPFRAFNGGNGDRPLYIGRASHEGSLTPGKIMPSHGVCYVSWGGKEHAKTDYQVLVGRDMHWVVASGGNFPRNAICAGSTEEGEQLFVGRTSHNGTLTVGKVQRSHNKLYIPYGGKEIPISNYEILVSN